jgi:hypothetical protein
MHNIPEIWPFDRRGVNLLVLRAEAKMCLLAGIYILKYYVERRGGATFKSSSQLRQLNGYLWNMECMKCIAGALFCLRLNIFVRLKA